MPTFKELSVHYKSAYWNRVRGKLLYDRGGRCERCRSTAWLQAHHVTYKHFRKELSHPEDLVLLCRECHSKEHDKKRKTKRSLVKTIIKAIVA